MLTGCGSSSSPPKTESTTEAKSHTIFKTDGVFEAKAGDVMESGDVMGINFSLNDEELKTITSNFHPTSIKKKSSKTIEAIMNEDYYEFDFYNQSGETCGLLFLMKNDSKVWYMEKLDVNNTTIYPVDDASLVSSLRQVIEPHLGDYHTTPEE